MYLHRYCALCHFKFHNTAVVTFISIYLVLVLFLGGFRKEYFAVFNFILGLYIFAF